jgi:hypothetical protein
MGCLYIQKRNSITTLRHKRCFLIQISLLVCVCPTRVNFPSFPAGKCTPHFRKLALARQRKDSAENQIHYLPIEIFALALAAHSGTAA